jgi:hypothetical protein
MRRGALRTNPSPYVVTVSHCASIGEPFALGVQPPAGTFTYSK